MQQSPTELEDLIVKVQTLTDDVDAYYDHLKSGTLDKFYQQIVETIVVDMMRLPVERTLSGLGPIEDPDDVSRSVTQIAEIISASFNRSKDQVRADIIQAVTACPADDIRSARMLRHNNMLH